MSNHQGDKKKIGVFNASGLKGAIPWIILICGIIFLTLGFFDICKKVVFNDILREVGNICIVGVLVGYVTSSAQFMGVFKNELEDIIYDLKFLKKRNDIHIIWEKVSKTLFKSKFPEISIELLNIIKDKYFPLNQVSYYKDYQSIITITWVDEEKKIIKVEYEISFELISSTKNKFNFPLDSRVNVEGIDFNNYSINVENYTVNGKPAVVVKKVDKIEDKFHHFGIEVLLSGSDKYAISKKIIKQYSLEKDYHLSFSAKYIVKNYRIQIFCPNNISLCFIEKGTIEKFNNVKDRPGYLESHYKGLILPRQGYICILKQI